ncbi:ATP-binding protein [Nisaea nitritireducens]|uniref:ATP-binding protein n=1 Tax=Nisaea nitritireducens TaxID=568392 RepID=UPI001865D08B|nr:ATP-binding protein [Nisaea nitritireducens]
MTSEKRPGRRFRLGLKTWVFVAPIITVLIFAGLLITVLQSNSEKRRDLAQLQMSAISRLDKVTSLGERVAAVHLEMQSILGRAGELEEGELYDLARPHINRLHDIKKELESIQGTLDAQSLDGRLFRQFGQNFETFRQNYISAVLMTSVNMARYAEQMSRTNRQYEEVFHDLGELMNVNLQDNSDASEAYAALDRRLTQTLLAGLAFCVPLSLLVSWFINRLMSRDLIDAITALGNLAKGQPSNFLPDQNRTDEIGELGRAISYFESILDQLRQEVSERERSETQYRDLFDSAGDAIFVFANRRYTALNKKAEEMFGVEAAQVLGTPLGTLSGSVHGTQETTVKNLNAIFDEARKGTPQVVQWRGRKLNGTEFPTELTVTAFEGPDQIEIAQFMVRDISEKIEADKLRENMTAELERMVSERTEELQREVVVRRQTEEALETERKTLEAVVNYAPIGMILLDTENRVRLTNTWIRKAHKFPDRICTPGTPYIEILKHIHTSKRNQQRDPKKLEKILSERTALLERRESNVFEDILPDGSYHKVERRFVDDVGCIVTNTDITDLKSAQNELVRQEKMAALGALVAGVAHEVNTPLGICVTAASHVADIAREFDREIRSPESRLTRELAVDRLSNIGNGLEIVERNLNRAADLIKNFKLVAVDQTADDAREIELGTYIDSTIQSLSAETRRRGLTVRFAEPSENLHRLTYPGAIAQILTNLIMNAGIHAYDSNGGEIEIEVQRLSNGADRILVRDFGKGMDEKTRAQIFDPFFTTRRANGGTGLGMHIVFNLATQRLGGKINCRSKPGEGTEIEVILP